MKLRCIAVDDEPLALNIIEDYIRQIDYLEYLNGFDNPLEVITYLKNHDVDLLFLDIQMSKLTGIQLLEVIKNKPFVIFTTAYEKYALQGYELDVLDYLLKPISFERFVKSVDKAYERIKLKVSDAVSNEKTLISNPKENYLFVKTGNKLQKIDFEDIFYIEGMSEYLKIVTSNGYILTLQNFTKLSSALPKDTFVRVHKSYMVSIDKIESIERNRIKIMDKMIPISNTYKKTFYDVLNNTGIF